ncbi:MAG: AraC family ligand binding domain-containing protein [Spirosomataceae bacterium]
MKLAKPIETSTEDFFFVPLKFKSFRVMESCIHTRQNEVCKGEMFLEEHLIYYIHKGKNTFGYGKMTYEVKAGELIILPKATSITYEKDGLENEDFMYHGIMFFLQDELITDFLQTSNINFLQNNEPTQIKIWPVKDRLKRFLNRSCPILKNLIKSKKGLLE